VPLAEIPNLIADGEITHSLVIAAFSFFFSKEIAAHRQQR
jgi:hypothetical protein